MYLCKDSCMAGNLTDGKRWFIDFAWTPCWVFVSVFSMNIRGKIGKFDLISIFYSEKFMKN